jgi:hypothetical protein
VGRKVFFHCARQGQQTLTTRGAKIFNYATLRLCTIIMHIMLGTCVPNLRGRRWVEHTQIHHALKRGTKKFHYTRNSWGIFSEFTFHETKIPTVDTKVQMCSKFRKFFSWKKVKSPLSMNFGRISTSKCRGKLQKMGVLYTHSPKSPGPFQKFIFF